MRAYALSFACCLHQAVSYSCFLLVLIPSKAAMGQEIIEELDEDDGWADDGGVDPGSQRKL